MVEKLSVSTDSREQLLDVTRKVQDVLDSSGVDSGVVTLFVPHTTAAITINENADPSVVHDILRGLREAVPHRAAYYKHAEGNSDAHIKSTLVGSSQQALVEDGELVLGTWQGLYFCEFDGPRSRKLWVKITPDEAEE